jgi:hypothetical protein
MALFHLNSYEHHHCSIPACRQSRIVDRTSKKGITTLSELDTLWFIFIITVATCHIKAQYKFDFQLSVFFKHTMG